MQIAPCSPPRAKMKGGGDVLNDGPAQVKQGFWRWGCVSWDPHSVWIPLCGVAASDSHTQRGGAHNTS